MNDVPTPLQRRKRAISSFMARIGQVGRTASRRRCEYTLPLFPLVLILDADDTLAEDARPIVERIAA